MRMPEAFTRLIPEKVKKLIPLKATTLDHFAELVRTQGGQSVHAEPVIKEKGLGSSSTTSVGRIGDTEYLTRYTSRSATGRKIVFTEVHESRYGSEHGFGDMDERTISTLRGLVTVEARLEELGELLPGVQMEGPAVDKTIREQMLAAARDRGIEPFPKLEAPGRRRRS